MNAVASPDAPKRAKSGSGMSADIANDPAGGGSGVKSQTEHVDKWLQKVSKLIYITMQVVAVLAQEKSVMLCLEDHNDMTAQVNFCFTQVIIVCLSLSRVAVVSFISVLLIIVRTFLVGAS